MTEHLTEAPQRLDPRRTRAVVKIAPLVDADLRQWVTRLFAGHRRDRTEVARQMVTDLAGAGFSESEIRARIVALAESFDGGEDRAS